MTIRLFFFLILILSNIISYAQTEAERKKISDSYDTESINELKVYFAKQNHERELRVKRYLMDKSLKNFVVKKGNSSLQLYDIVKGKPIYISSYNLNSAKASGTNDLWTGGNLNLNLNGENMIMGVWDLEYPLGTHQEFLDDQVIPQSRITYPDFLGTISSHATHVSATLIGNGTQTNAIGMASKASLKAYDANSDTTEGFNEAQGGLLISNHSYGFPIFINGNPNVAPADIGAYDSYARFWDLICFNFQYYLPVFASGNDGGTSYSGGAAIGYDKLTRAATSKNNLVVASANAFLSGDDLNFYFTDPTSSQGPTDDFRIKPDITADGTDVYSADSASNSAYTLKTGTSMASPTVAGSLILLQQYYNSLYSNYMKASTLKGLACHTAIDDNSNDGPDPVFGWGILNSGEAASIIADASNGLAVINELSLNNGETYTYNFSVSSPGSVKATICWTDPPGTVSSSPNNVLSPRLVNDLDLRITGPDATVHTPWKLDKTDVTANAIKGDNDVDNIEVIDINSGGAGNYTLSVSHKGSLTNDQQAFSLILTGTNLTLSAPEEVSENSVAIWPNPVRDRLNINFSSKLSTKSKIELYDIQGRKVFSNDIDIKENKNNYTINVMNYNPGLYILKIYDGLYIHRQKFIIK